METEKILNKIGQKEHEGVHAVIIRDNKILRGLRNYPTGQKWIIPGGRCEGDETIYETLKREIKEETGIEEFSVKEFLGKVEGIKAGYETNVFVCETDESPRRLEKENFKEWRWISLEESERLGANPKISELIKKYCKK